jgi:hypothetical protein
MLIGLLKKELLLIQHHNDYSSFGLWDSSAWKVPGIYWYVLRL